MLFDSILPTVELLSKLQSVLSKPSDTFSTKFMENSKSFVVISVIFTASSGVNFISGNHFLCSSISSNSSSVQVLPWYCSNSVTSSGSISNSSSLAISTTSAVTSSTQGLNPSRTEPLNLCGLESTSSKLLCMLIFWPLPVNHRCSFFFLIYLFIFGCVGSLFLCEGFL